MKKIVVAAAALLTTAAGAQAADLRAKAPYLKAPVAQVYDWTGFYVGANAGFGFGRSATTVLSLAPANEQARLGGLGALGGVQAATIGNSAASSASTMSCSVSRPISRRGLRRRPHLRPDDRRPQLHRVQSEDRLVRHRARPRRPRHGPGAEILHRRLRLRQRQDDV